MAPYITLYILAGCVAAAAVLFVVMIVITALRPPQLPDISAAPPPSLQRVIRALTPLPVAQPAAPIASAPRVSAPPAQVPPAAPARPPVVVPAAPPVVQPAPPVVRSRRSHPIARPSQPIARPTPTQKIARPAQPAAPRIGAAIAARRPVYPVKHSRPLLRVAAWLLVISSLAACAAITNPMLLDPLCDDYEWFGAETAQVARQYARDAHTAIAGLIQRW